MAQEFSPVSQEEIDARKQRAKDLGFHDQVLYHAGHTDFPQFQLQDWAKVTGEKAHFFTTKPEVADSYLGGQYIKADAPDAISHGVAKLTPSAVQPPNVGRIYATGAQVYPVKIRDLNEDHFDVWDMGGASYDPSFMKSALNQAKKNKSKGIVLRGVKDPGMFMSGPLGSANKPSTLVAVFDKYANHIRSVNAAFNKKDKNDRDLLKKDGGEVDGITAYHGSPHEFDKFDISKIGTGEGAQAYGHGLYFAEAEPVAQSYRDALTDPEQVPLHFEGKPLDTPWNNEIRERWPHHFEGKSEAHQDAMEELLGNLSQVRELDQVKNVLASVNPRAKSLYHTLVSKHINKPDIGKGSMYEVNINAHPDHFLDWDVPFRNQSEHVQNSLRALGFDPEKDWTHSSLRGNNIYNRLIMRGSNFEKLGVNSEARKADEADASKILSSVGIKGIKYLDAVSRGKGEGSRNYVVFDHNDVDIKRRYEQGGVVKPKKLPTYIPQKRDGGAIVKRALMVISKKA